ncbi:hypothetical protein XH98_20830 [Bradyrhizobium sp. CCBAU 51745]|nr:hypothetical protein [Bradyrhizobium sp. CCBAU 51745]
MAIIDTFNNTGTNDFNGEIVTLSLQARNVRIVSETSPSGDNAPSHRIYVGRVEIGTAWSERSNEAATISASSSATRASPHRSSRISSPMKRARASA